MNHLLTESLSKDTIFMLQALELATKAELHEEVPVGALLVHGDKIISQGFNFSVNSHDPTAHAEIIALREAGKVFQNYRFPGSTLFVTLEPCAMCVGALIHARVERIVFGANDPKSGALGGAFHLLEFGKFNHYPTFTGGINALECGQLLKKFFKKRR